MKTDDILILVDWIDQFIDGDRLVVLIAAYGINFELLHDDSTERIKLITLVSKNLDRSENRDFLLKIISEIGEYVHSASQAVPMMYRKDQFGELFERLVRINQIVKGSTLEEEITIPKESPFTAKSIIREFLSKAKTEILLVDAYVGVRTLDCFRDIKNQKVKVLTKNRNYLDDTLIRELKDYTKENRTIEVKIHCGLHDRFISFNDRLWGAGGSFKDAGEKRFTLFEIIEKKVDIIVDLHAQWDEAEKFEF